MLLNRLEIRKRNKLIKVSRNFYNYRSYERFVLIRRQLKDLKIVSSILIDTV
jgi:hypothetical protein